MTLYDVKINQLVKVKSLNIDSSLSQRLHDFGLINNTIISPVFYSPFSDPIAYEFRGNIVAIRNEDAKKINVVVIK